MATGEEEKKKTSNEIKSEPPVKIEIKGEPPVKIESNGEPPIKKGNDPVNEEILKIFPERRGAKLKKSRNLLFTDPDMSRESCEIDFLNFVKNSPVMSTLILGLESHGCELDLRRHFSCEPCVSPSLGGYDAWYNQIVVCSNKEFNPNPNYFKVLTEMIHMFDACRARIDFSNPYHVACTEIRSANLLGCSIFKSIWHSHTKMHHIKSNHQECVRVSAFQSMRAAFPELNNSAIYKIIDSVFDKCYNDLEPFGRRIMNQRDSYLAYRERFIFDKNQK